MPASHTPSELDPAISILVVEDSPTQLLKIRHALERHRFQVRTASNGAEALAQLESAPATIVLTDVMMPEMDGYELCRTIRSRPELARIPVVLLTALSEPKDIIAGLKAGASGYIVKPWTEPMLISRIQYVQANLELRRHGNIEMGIEVYFANQRHFLTADRLQMVDLLLSTYDAALQKSAELEVANRELKQALATIKTLKGMVPLCMVCKKIRADDGFWQQLEAYLAEHSDAEISHGICPDCLEEYRRDPTRWDQLSQTQRGSLPPRTS